ncbi:hypothetical protein WIW50_11790 [Flavobacteriaceae bacterium 3-367]|uniref:hypothetical protein n=1 Tax=Eudoraea algarum TaxID=3417568 RepID=UPI00326DE268
MKKQTIYLLLFTLVTFTISCSNDDDTDVTPENLNNVTDCEIAIEPNLLISICVDGADFALPDEVIKFVSTFYSKNDTPSNAQFLWTVESGSMEIIDVENTVDGLIAKSIATIKFNSDYSGNGVISANAENDRGSGYAQHSVELASTQ